MCQRGAAQSPWDEDSDDEEEHPEWFYGVVTIVRKTGCTMLFQGDDIGTRHDAHLETWDKYRVDDDDQDDFDELVFQANPTLRVVVPGDRPSGRRHCDADYGHQPGQVDR